MGILAKQLTCAVITHILGILLIGASPLHVDDGLFMGDKVFQEKVVNPMKAHFAIKGMSREKFKYLAGAAEYFPEENASETDYNGLFSKKLTPVPVPRMPPDDALLTDRLHSTRKLEISE